MFKLLSLIMLCEFNIYAFQNIYFPDLQTFIFFNICKHLSFVMVITDSEKNELTFIIISI